MALPASKEVKFEFELIDYRLGIGNARIHLMRAEHYITTTKDEAIGPPTIAIITRFCSRVVNRPMRTAYTTYIYLEV